jgi:hypothetical protein
MSWFGKVSDALKGFTDHVQTGTKTVRENILGGFEDARDIGEKSVHDFKEGHFGAAIGEKVLHDAAVLGNVASLGAAHGIGQKLADSGKLDSIFEKASAELNGSKGGLYTGAMDVLGNVGNAVALGQAGAVTDQDKWPQGREKKIIGNSQGVYKRGEGLGAVMKAAREGVMNVAAEKAAKDTPIAASVAAGVAGATAGLANAAANLADANKAGRGYEAELQVQSDSAANEKEAGE